IPSVPMLAMTLGCGRTRIPSCSRGCLPRKKNKNLAQRAQRGNDMMIRGRASFFFCVLCVFASLRETSLHAAEPWVTCRGNLQRTGNTYGVAGPATPKILWVHRLQDHFIAARVPAGDRVYLAGLGA